MSNKICKGCGTENEEMYRFCKNCGREFESEANQSYEYNNYDSRNEGGFSDFSGRQSMPDIEGISAEEMATFIGAKHRKILPKFAKMELSGSKAGWCWPVAILSYLFGPVGAAIWFLYRKMYKVAILFFAIGVILNGALSFVDAYMLKSENVSMEDILDIYGDYVDGDVEFDEYLNEIYSLELPVTAGISNLINISCTVITGIFAYNWYKKFAVKKIKKLRASNIDMRYYPFALSASGGTSGGAVALGVILWALLFSVISGIAAIFGMV